MRTLTLFSFLLALAGCGGPEQPTDAGPSDSTTSGEAPASQLLAGDLVDAVGVVAAKAVEPGDDVVVVGRVQRLAKGVFVLVDDEAAKYCGQIPGTDDACPTPWDYCCTPPDELKAAQLVVEAYDAEGNPVAKEAMGIRPLDLIALRGTLERDEAGELFVKASDGWHRRERPVLGLHVRFP